MSSTHPKALKNGIRKSKLEKLKILKALKQKQSNDKFASKQLGDEKVNWYDYDDEFVRTKMFPMAAAAYADEASIQKCLRNTFKNATLYRDIEVHCQGYESQLCSAFTAVNHDDQAIIIAFRGTNSFPQLTIEGYESLLSFKIPSPVGGYIGGYFASIYTDLYYTGGLLDDIAMLRSKYKNYEVWITGHSLGGALASIAASYMAEDFNVPEEKIKLLTIGQPRTGDAEWVAGIDEAVPWFNYRVVHARDVVAHIPPRNFENYGHYRSEVWYPSKMGSSDKFILCDDDDEDDMNCSNQLYRYSVKDHLVYFNEMVSDFGKSGCVWKK